MSGKNNYQLETTNLRKQNRLLKFVVIFLSILSIGQAIATLYFNHDGSKMQLQRQVEDQRQMIDQLRTEINDSNKDANIETNN
ncbi:hypothetical protein SAMN04487792_1633 [Lactobacillus bombicola]|uniref:Uncharacterized protein n=1 Tax=Lactobacillus bombicola TaxID=1505723 RepID=A0A1I1U0W0_9LACO|nr:hypothetical protein [Lactobacillus bombicola]SFD62333.1 hypothetical protein SAMN04487792_1633 [Lactobacillus bombicola]